jgi:sensor histidine kinase regulating citrate/malate metabolism
MTIRDHSEIKSLADELSATRSMADALRASAHESANRLHTVVMLAQLGDVDAAVRLATGEVRAARMLTSRLSGQFEEAALVALLLGKASEATQRTIDLAVTESSWLPADSVEPVDLITIVGNLVDNAMDAALEGLAPRRVEVSIKAVGRDIVVRVADSGRGFSPEALERVFEPGWSTKLSGPDRRHGRGIGMALVHQVATRLGGSVTVANGSTDDGLTGGIVMVRLPQLVATDVVPHEDATT